MWYCQVKYDFDNGKFVKEHILSTSYFGIPFLCGFKNHMENVKSEIDNSYNMCNHVTLMNKIG